MKQFRTTLFVLVLVFLVMILPTTLFARVDVQTDADSVKFQPAFLETNLDGSEIPPVEGAVPYRYPIISTPPQTGRFTPLAPDQLMIDIWYGTTQTFGQLGNPQDVINILGTVSGPNEITSLSYSLNGKPSKPLNIGSNKERLYGPGDFNIDIGLDELIYGANQIEITADDDIEIKTETVTVNLVDGGVWPLPYTADWSSLGGNIQNGAQVVDGLWTINGQGKLTNTTPGYDRLVAIGDVAWTDFEVKVPVKILSLNTNDWTGPSNGAGVGLLIRWRGHTRITEDDQPGSNWRNLGALAWHRWLPDGSAAFEMLGNGGSSMIYRNDDQIKLGKEYIFKASVKNSGIPGQPATYLFKFWESNQPEPADWYMSSIGNPGELTSGSLVLAAHQAIVEFGNVEIKPLPTGPFTITELGATNGQVIIEPKKASYNYGERVTIRAVGNSGFALSGWTGSFSGTENPHTIQITQNIAVGATFSQATDPTLTIVTNGQGTVDKNPSKSSYFYGELVTLTPKPKSGHIFGSWDNDLTGTDNQAAIVMDQDKNIVANFVQANPNSPVSDDFNVCDLDTNLWKFVNPLGDGTYSINGSELTLTVPSNVAHDIWVGGNNSARLMQPTLNTNFEIIVKFESKVTKGFQMQGILVEQDPNNFLRIEIHNDGGSVRPYVASFKNGNPTTLIWGKERLQDTPTYLRLTRVSDKWTYAYSYNGTNWTTVGSFSLNMNVTSSGVYAANQRSLFAPSIPAHTTIVDYFFNSTSPIVPEDANPIDDFSLQVDTVGQGNVSINPDKDSYECNEVVTLTAVPATNWEFKGWSGDLSGSASVQQLTMVRNYQVLATFAEKSVEEKYLLFLPASLK